MALLAQLEFDANVSVPPVVPQRESSQLSDQPVLPTPSFASKGAKKPRERWTADEHERFLEGLKMFHRDWKSIESAFLLAGYDHHGAISRSMYMEWSRWQAFRCTGEHKHSISMFVVFGQAACG